MLKTANRCKSAFSGRYPTLERNEKGNWFLDQKEVTQDEAINELVEAVKDLGYWCQVAKDVLPTEQFEMVQEAYEYE